MGVFLPQIVSDVADIASLIGIAVTIYVATQTRLIKHHFFSKVRLRETLPDLRAEVEGYLASLSTWTEDSHNELTTQKFNSVRVILKNIRGKVTSIELQEINSVLDKMWTRKYWFIQRNVSDMSLEECWELAGQMNAIVVMLDQRIKDMNWTDK